MDFLVLTWVVIAVSVSVEAAVAVSRRYIRETRSVEVSALYIII